MNYEYFMLNYGETKSQPNYIELGQWIDELGSIQQWSDVHKKDVYVEYRNLLKAKRDHCWMLDNRYKNPFNEPLLYTSVEIINELSKVVNKNWETWNLDTGV